MATVEVRFPNEPVEFDKSSFVPSPVTVPVAAAVEFDKSSFVGTPAKTEKVFLESQQKVVELPAGGIARLKAIASGAYDKGEAGRQVGELYFQQLIGNDTPEIQNAINSLKEKSSVEFGGLGTVEDIVRAGVEQTPQMLGLINRGARRGLQGALMGGTIGAAGGPAAPVTVTGGAAAGAAIGTTFGIAEHSFVQNAGESYGYMSELLDKEGVQLEKQNLARLGAVLSGGVNAGLDTVSFGMLSKVLLGRNLALDALKKTGAKAIVIPKTKEAIGKFIVELGKAIAAETVTEGVQEGVKLESGEVVKYLSDQEFDSMTGTQIFEQMGKASAEAAKATLALGGAGGTVKGGYALTKGAIGKKYRELKSDDASSMTSDPTLAAKIILESDKASPEVKARVQALVDSNDFTMEELRAAASADASSAATVKDTGTLISEADMLDEIAAENEIAGDTQTAAMQKEMAAERRQQAATLATGMQAESAGRANEAISPIMAQEKAAQQKQIENIQAETDDISINLLREVAALQESKDIIDPEVKAILENTRTSLQEQRETPKPLSLVAYVKSIGGVKEYSGELQNMGMKNRAKDGARNDKTGLDLDMAREAAAEAGYVDMGSTREDFIVALENDFKVPNSVIAEKDVGTQIKLDEIDSILSNLDKELSDRGITYSRKALEDLRRRVAANRAIDKKIARETKVREAQLQRLESDKRKAEMSSPAILADKLKTFISGMRKGGVLQKQETKAVQENLIQIIGESELDAADRAKFISAVKNTQTIEQLEAGLPDILARIDTLSDKAKRRSIISKIKKTLSSVKDSDVIAVDFANRIQDLVGEIDLTKRKQETIDSLQTTLDYMKNNPSADMPKDVLRKLQILNKKSINDISTPELESIASDIDRLVKMGRLKMESIQRKKEREKQAKLVELAKDSTSFEDRDIEAGSIGEKLGASQRIKNSYIARRNALSRIGKSTNPMDVFFDMLDGGKKYLGANYKIFKETVDKSYSRYLNLKEQTTRDVKNLADKLDLTEQNFDRIGAYAVLAQEGGRQKLLDTGFDAKDIDGLTLSDPEMQMYKLMRERLDGMLPKIQRVMLDVYNKNVQAISDYFPFLTDFEAAKDLEIHDQLGPEAPFIAQKKNAERGFTVSRTLGKQKIRIDALGVFLNHVDNASYLIEMGKDIRELGDLAGSKEYGAAVGNVGQEMVVDWINLLARKGTVPGRIAMLDAFRKNVSFAILGYKLSTILVQPTALADGAALVGGSYVANGVRNVTKREWRQFIWDNMPEVRERVGDDPAYLEFGGRGTFKKVQEGGFWASRQIDSLVASAVAIGAYTKAVEAKGGVVDLSNPDPDAIVEAQRLMRRTQSSAFAKDAPALITQGNLTGNISLDRLLFQFQSFMLNRWSLIKHDMWQNGVRGNDTMQAVNIALWLTIATASEVALRELSKGIIDAVFSGSGDDDKKDEKSYGGKMALSALGSVPFVSQVVSAFEYGSVPVPSLSLVVQVAERVEWAGRSKDTSKKMQHYTEALVLVAGVGFGVPGTLQMEQIIRKAMKEDMKKNGWGSDDW